MRAEFAFAVIRNPQPPEPRPEAPGRRERFRIVPGAGGEGVPLVEILEELRLLRSMVCHDLTVNQFAELTTQSPQTVRRKIRDRAWLTGRIPVFTQEEGVGWRCRWEDYIEWRSKRSR